MTDEERENLLNAPAFGDGSAVTKPEGEVTEGEAPAESEEESKVPYSRFKKFHEEAQRYRAEADDLRAKLAEIAYQPQQVEEEEVPARWVKLYGDSDASREAWREQQKLNEETIARARQEAIEAVRGERYQEVERIETNISYLDDEMEALESYVGRELTAKEQDAILDIVDDYTPKGRDGNYAGNILSMDKAWEIYELRNKASTAPKRMARDGIASLSGNQSQGVSDAQAERDKAFNPLDWGSYQKRL